MRMSADVEHIDDQDVTVSNTLQQENIEYRSNVNAVTPVNRLFLVKYVNGRKTEFRKCIKCGDEIKAPNSGTSALSKHSERCESKGGRLQRDHWGSKIYHFRRRQK